MAINNIHTIKTKFKNLKFQLKFEKSLKNDYFLNKHFEPLNSKTFNKIWSGSIEKCSKYFKNA